MQKLLDHDYAISFFSGSGLRYRITSPYALFRHEECVICHENLLSNNTEEQPILLTHSGKCEETFHGLCLMESLKHKHDRCPYCQDEVEGSISLAMKTSRFGSFIPNEPDRDVWHSQAELADAKAQFKNICDAHSKLHEIEDYVFSLVEQMHIVDEGHERINTLRRIDDMLAADVPERLQSLTSLHGRKDFFDEMRRFWGYHERAYQYTSCAYLMVVAESWRRKLTPVACLFMLHN